MYQRDPLLRFFTCLPSPVIFIVLLPFFLLLFSFLSSGCIAVDSIGVRGLPVRTGFYAGVNAKYTENQSGEKDSPFGVELGYVESRFRMEEILDDSSFESVEQDLYYSVSAVLSSGDAPSEFSLAGGFWYFSGGMSLYTTEDASWSRSHVSIPIIPFFGEAVPGYTTFSFYGGNTEKVMDIDFHYTIYDFSGGMLNTVSPYLSLGQRFSAYEGDRSNAAFFSSIAFVNDWGTGTGKQSLQVELSLITDNSAWFGSSESEYQPWYGVEPYDLKTKAALQIRYYF